MTVGSVPSSGLAHVQDRIATIQAQIAALTPQRVASATAPSPSAIASPAAVAPGSAFASVLNEAVQRQATPGSSVAGALPPGVTPIGGPLLPAPASPAARANDGGWVMPASGRISSGYGERHGVAGRAHEFHTGLDIAAPTGTPVRAASAGVVRSAGPDGNYGNSVVIDHGNGVTTRYAHNSTLQVTVGQQVRAGDRIAAVGSTGRSTGPHLHFEVRVKGEHVDPRAWLAKHS